MVLLALFSKCPQGPILMFNVSCSLKIARSGTDKLFRVFHFTLFEINSLRTLWVQLLIVEAALKKVLTIHIASTCNCGGPSHIAEVVAAQPRVPVSTSQPQQPQIQASVTEVSSSQSQSQQQSDSENTTPAKSNDHSTSAADSQAPVTEPGSTSQKEAGIEKRTIPTESYARVVFMFSTLLMICESPNVMS